MNALTRIFFHMDARKPHFLGVPIGRDLNIAVFGDGEFIHADLVAFGQIGIEIILARPAAGRCDLAVGCGRGTQGKFNNFFIEDG